MKTQIRNWGVVAFVCAACSSPPDEPKTTADMGVEDTSVPDGADASTEPDAAAVPVETLVRAAREAHCDLLAECLPQWAYDFQFADRDDCVSRALDRGWWNLPGVEVDAESYATCPDAWADLTCEEWVTGPDVCIVQGTRAIGEACQAPQQCESTHCEVEPDAGCGTCAAPSTPGDPCKVRTVDGVEFEYCSHGLVCAADGTCNVPGLSGEACDTGECRADLSCVEGTCVARASLDEPCGADLPRCNDGEGLICDAQTSTCVQFELVEIGESCDGAACRAPGTCIDGTCVAPAAVGEACATAQRCEGGARCVQGSCTVPVCE